MNRMLNRTIVLLLLLGMTQAAAPDQSGGLLIEHELRLEFNQAADEVRVKDRLVLPPGASTLELTRRAGALTWQPDLLVEQGGGPGLRRFTVSAGKNRRVELRYTLRLADSSGKGIVWDGSRLWYASVPGGMHAFTLTVNMPAAWRSVSQGARRRSEAAGDARIETWRERAPQQEIYLVAAPFTEYSREAGDLRFMAFLRRPDPTLARRYLDLTGRYVRMYEELIGEYPYAKFALVENTRETGWGMPSFTLLGPRVIRLPFIPYTSYPHEILHNWWGNSVYVDYDTGNWSEGLTAYLADHRLKAERGEGAQYRRDALQKYRSFVSTGRDFPLNEFRARHDEASQAVGYNKSLMLFHMLRRRLGESVFFDALRELYRSYRFQTASFSDLRRVFERVSGDELQGFFDQWVRRTGAPAIALEDVELVRDADAFRVRGRLVQTQPGPVYDLEIPVRVQGEAASSEHTVALAERQAGFELKADYQPVGVTVDPEFDVFRRLDGRELPPSLGEAFGADRLTFVLPHDVAERERASYETFITPWRNGQREVAVVSDDASLPADGALWLLGWDNARRAKLESSLPSRGAGFDAGAVAVEGERLASADTAVVLAARDAAGRPLIWTHLADAEPGRTARRLQHYSRVSYVAFRGGEPVLRGQWPVTDSPLAVRFTPEPAESGPD